MLKYLTSKFPHLKHQLRVAHMATKPEAFIKRALTRAALGSFLLSILLAMLISKTNGSWGLWAFVTVAMFLGGFWLGMKKPLILARKRAVDIDREVLFAGRFLLIKLHSGKPLVNALIEAAQSYGVASKYFAEIVRDIELGTTLEDAIERSMTYTPSDAFRKILFQIHNALRLGIDVTQSLEAVLEDITKEQLLEIERYGKKLPSATLFYMLLAIVFPSLGMTIFTVIMTFTSITMNMTSYMVVVLFLAIINFLFITVFRAIRPKVNI